MKTKKKIIICICSRKLNRDLLNLLDSISKNIYPKRINVKVLIVINNSIKILSTQKRKIKQSEVVDLAPPLLFSEPKAPRKFWLLIKL